VGGAHGGEGLSGRGELWSGGTAPVDDAPASIAKERRPRPSCLQAGRRRMLYDLEAAFVRRRKSCYAPADP